MSKIRFGIIGGGWRSEFFLRVAQYLPEVFEVSSVLMRSQEKADVLSAKFGIKTTLSYDEFIEDKPSYAILAISRKATLAYIEKLFKSDIAVLCETPPADTVKELNELWSVIKKYDGKMQVAEQYFAQPIYSAWLNVVDQGLIGETSLVNISAIHGYHGINILKKFLHITKENCTIYGKQYSIPVTVTGGRDAVDHSGKLTTQPQDRVTFEFENGKFAFYNWSGLQYHSKIRTRHFTVQGERGEIDDLTIRYLNSKNEAVTQSFNRIDGGIYDLDGWTHRGIMLGENYIYKNPFEESRLNDDEIAVAYCMYKMKDLVETGEEYYPMPEALQDSYLSILLYQCLETPLVPIQTETQSWYKE